MGTQDDDVNWDYDDVADDDITDSIEETEVRTDDNVVMDAADRQLMDISVRLTARYDGRAAPAANPRARAAGLGDEGRPVPLRKG